MKYISIILFSVISLSSLKSQTTDQSPFRQMYDLLPTANTYRTATGAPGHEYYQQRADYNINVELDDENQKIYGEETITFFNNSPDILNYLWLQLDQNIRIKRIRYT